MDLQSSPQGVVAGSIPLFAGHPAHELLPISTVRTLVDSIWSGPDVVRLFNYGDEQGNRQLIDFLAARHQQCENLNIGREHLMIIGGSTWGVGMITHHLAGPGDTVLVDAPSYRDALHIFRDAKLDLQAIAIDDGGVIVDEMERRLRDLASVRRRPKFYYVVPNFQNPTGITLARERRQAIVDLSKEYGFVIVEDDVYRDIRFVDDLPPSFYALSRGENVLRLGTFSKTLAPGLRIGWLIGPAETVKRFVTSGMLRMGGGANPFAAAIVADFCSSGRWEEHVARLRNQYKLRRDCALAALDAVMPDSARWTRPEGGYFIWLQLPDYVTVDELEGQAQAENVYFASGKGFFVHPEDGAHHLRLSFSYVPLDDLRSGIATLGRIIKGARRSHRSRRSRRH
ncbi:MAG: PLP-dependent aminotransferase family protein [Chloroflexi bacterium]|nr:PLP-dependent aminotransferase family protein [Chloroflexota bacterium]